MVSLCGLRDHGEEEDVEVGIASGDGSGVSAVAAMSFPNNDTDGECIGTWTGRRALPVSGNVRGSFCGLTVAGGCSAVGESPSESHELGANAEGCMLWAAGRMGAALAAGFRTGLVGLRDTAERGHAASTLLASMEEPAGEPSDSAADPTDTAKDCSCRCTPPADMFIAEDCVLCVADIGEGWRGGGR